MAEAKAFKIMPHCTKDTIQYEMDELIRCKDCKHRPIKPDNYKGYGFSLNFPDYDYRCPCRCDDPYYSWYPDDDWFCANGERR